MSGWLPLTARPFPRNRGNDPHSSLAQPPFSKFLRARYHPPPPTDASTGRRSPKPKSVPHSRGDERPFVPGPRHGISPRGFSFTPPFRPAFRRPHTRVPDLRTPRRKGCGPGPVRSGRSGRASGLIVSDFRSARIRRRTRPTNFWKPPATPLYTSNLHDPFGFVARWRIEERYLFCRNDSLP